jgi:ribosomal protein S27E
MSEPFLVAIRCPQCGAETDFPEGAYALRCAYCGVTLRVLGANRGGRARFLMLPTVEARELAGVLAAWAIEQGRRLGTIEWQALLVAPFWRARGLALRWVYYRTARGESEALEETTGISLTSHGVYEGDLDVDTLTGGLRRASAVPHDDRTFQTRHVDLSFPAFDGADLGLVSLGVRPGVRPLRILAPDVIPEGAKLLPLAMEAEAALARTTSGAEEGFEEVSGRPDFERAAVVTTSLSAIYFPFWAASARIDGAERLLVVDAVAGSVVRDGDPAEPWFATLPTASRPPLASGSLGFLPLKCPECAWALPLEASAIVHLCTQCGRAWQEGGDRFVPLAYDAVPAKGAACYLPAWRFEARLALDGKPLAGAADLPRLFRPVGWPIPPAADEEAARPAALYVPAFECRALSVLERLATALTRLQPRLDDADGPARRGPLPLSPTPRAIGASVDAADAATLARLFLVGLVPGAGPAARRRLATLEVELGPGRLVWLPADDRGSYLQDRLTGVSLPKAALGWAANTPP